MFDKQAFHSLSYGMYVIGARCDGRDYGCVANTFAQVTSSPLQVSVALNKENATTAAVRQAGRFTASCLSEQADMQLIGTFGFHTSTELDKFAQHASARDEAGMPYVAEQCCAWFSASVVSELVLGTHVLFVGGAVSYTHLTLPTNSEVEVPAAAAYLHLTRPPSRSDVSVDIERK